MDILWLHQSLPVVNAWCRFIPTTLLKRRFFMEHAQMLEICKRHLVSDSVDVVIPEPYIPYIPDNWNGILVLAEAQNLSKSSKNYVEYLKNSSAETKFSRLKNPDNLGIGPWDDGSLKLAIHAAFNEMPQNTAVSNAVLWSQITAEGNNANPSDMLVDHAVNFWNDMLSLISPRHVISCGKKAHRVIDSIKSGAWKRHRLSLPSPNLLSRISYMFSETDLLQRYPEVKNTIDIFPELVSKNRRNKIFYACHAVSLCNRI
jgi:hypothetical protein